MKQAFSDINLLSLCRLFGYSRQAFYKHQKQQALQISNSQRIIEQVLRIRKQQPRCGGRKLLVMLQPFFEEQTIRIGRDSFFELLAKKQAAGAEAKKKCAHHQQQTFLLPLS